MRSTSTAALSVFAVALSSMSARADDPSTVSVEDAASGCAFVNAPIKTTLYVDGCTSVICTAGTTGSGMLEGSTQFTLLTLGPGDLPGQLVYSGQLVITAADALRSACGPSNGRWSRTASQACATRRRAEFQACDGEWRRREVHASVSGRGRMMIAVQIPATSNAAVTPIAMGRKPRPLPRLRRGGASSSVTSKMSGSGFRETGRRFGPAGRAGRGGCWPGRRLLHVGPTPSSPAAGVYKAPHVEPPTTA